MYRKYYETASSLAEKIRQGNYKRPTEPATKSLVPERQKKTETKEESGTNPLLLQEKMIASYMASMRSNQEEQGRVPGVKGPAVSGTLSQVMSSIAAVESKGSGDYSALGPVMESGSYSGDRAYGKYQVMGKNVPSWTKEALGYSMTPDEFLASPEAQDAVAAHKLQKYYDKHGTWEDAASVWFSGQPLSKSKDRSDGYLTTEQYVAKFKKYFDEQPIVRRKDNA